MNFGYLICITENTNTDYLKLAYGLALSIKNTQKPGYDKVALVTYDKSAVDDLNSSWVFDEVVEFNEQQGWDVRSWMDKLSPWDNTVCLDADMMFFRDCSHWIDYFVENCDLYIPNKSYTYRNEVVSSDYYRRAFTKNDLPNLYSFYTFFKKDSAIAKEFFDLNRYIVTYPTEFSNTFLAEHKPTVVGTDEAFALSAKILDIYDEISYPLDFPRVVHWKVEIQNFPWPAERASDHIGFYLDRNAKLKLGNYQQFNIVHYVEKDKMTDELINVLEEIAWKSD